MRIFNEDKTQELFNVDLLNGKLVEDTLTIHHNAIVGQNEVSHYEVVREYSNGGKDVKKIIDAPKIESKDAYDEIEDINIYIPYTQEELEYIARKKRIDELKKFLCETDYQAIKHSEGVMTEEEYSPIKAIRQAWRDEINQLEDNHGRY